MLNNKKSLPLRHFEVFLSGTPVIDHIWMYGCGHEIIRSTSYNWNGMMRGAEPMAVWQYTLKGFGMVRRGGRDYRVDPGQAFLLPIPDEHVYFFPKESTHWEFIFLTLAGTETMRLWHELIKEVGPVATFGDDARCVNTANEILSLRQQEKLSSPYLVSRYVYDFIMDVFMDLKFDHSGRRDCPPFIVQVTDHCLKNLSRRISIDQLAEIAGLSRAHFSREFARHVGMPPAEYIHELRMRKALTMLQNEQMTVKEIAFACGFDDCSYFCKVFRAFYGKTPAMFRLGA